MTIPTLITNNQEKGWQTSASTFEAKFGQALKVMNTQNTLAGLNTTENFVAELQRHMKINKVCDNSKLTDCFTSEINGAKYVVDVADATTYENDASTSKPTKTNTLITADKIGQKDWNTNTMGLQFANGVSAIVAYNPRCSANPFNNDSITIGGSKNNITFDTDCVAVVYDTQSFKNPNELNKDIRTSSRATIGDGNCVFKIDGACVTQVPFKPNPHKWNNCTIPLSDPDDIAFGKKYGITNCCNNGNCVGAPSNGDTWASSVATCGDISKIPTLNQLAKIANYIYDTTDIDADTNKENLILNTTKLTSIGLPSGEFTIWAEESTWYAASSRYFGLTSSKRNDWYKYYHVPYAICVEK